MATVTNPTPCLVGLHGRADGRLQPADLEVVRVARVQAVKLLSTADPADVAALRAINKQILVVVRLFADLRSRKATPADFVSWVEGDMRAFYQQGVRYFEVHNEPNLTAEGWKLSWAGGAEFGQWFREVCTRLRQLFPEARLGWPGLSPGEGLTIRQAEETFLALAGQAVASADWIGVHCYWQNVIEQGLARGGQSYRAYQRNYPGKALLITEFSNPNAAVPDNERARQYVDYYRSLRSERGVVAAFSFVASASDQAFAVEAWRREDGRLTDIPAAVGAYVTSLTTVKPTPPASTPPATPAPAAAGSVYRVTAKGLNIRQSPWLTSVEPPVVGYLNEDDQVTVVKVASGWGLLERPAPGWVKMEFLAPVTGPVITPVPLPTPPPVPLPLPAPSGQRCPTGKGILIWQPERTADGDPQMAVKMALEAHFAWVSLKIADSPSSYPFTAANEKLLQALVAGFRAAGLKVHGWHYVKGINPAGEADIALKRIRDLKLDGYQIDAEAEYKLPGRAPAARAFMERLRAGTDVPIGLCAYRFPQSHPQLPWAEFLAHCDYHAPQVYPMGQSSVTAFGVQLKESVRQLTARRPLPVVPIGPAYRDKFTPLGSTEEVYWEPSTAQLNDFHTTARALGLPGEGWYSWQAAAERSWWTTIAGQVV